MKLSHIAINSVKCQTGLVPIVDDEICEELDDTFGAHTFYADERGLFTFDVGNDHDKRKPCLGLVHLASWKKDSELCLILDGPIFTDVVMEIDVERSKDIGRSAREANE